MATIARLFALMLLVLLPPMAAVRADPPISNSELSLMLRGGYTSDEVLHEVATRKALEPLDGAAEKTLRENGANQALIDALKSGRYILSKAAADQARELQAVREQQLEADRSAGSDRLLENARQQAQAALGRHMANLLRDKLVVCRDGQMQPYDPNVLATKKIFAIYYSASWCVPCQHFTPLLVDFYQQFEPGHPEFEIVLVSADHSAEDMQKYMQADGMPFPALSFDLKEKTPEMTKYAGDAIPDLVLINGAGGVVSDTYVNKQYVGPRHVLEDLAKLAGMNVAWPGSTPGPAAKPQ
jgi:nucleoredoxin